MSLENSTVVISWAWKTSSEGLQYKQVVGLWTFNSEEDAEEFIINQGTGNYKIGNTNPFISPISLEEMQHYDLVYASPQIINNQAFVKIFEYTGE